MARSSGADLRAPVFNGDNFDFWQIRKNTIFRSHELWDNVEKGFATPAKKDEKLTKAESKLETAHVVWNVLKQEFVGDKQVKAVKLQGLRRDFEYTRMGENEAFSAYLVKLFDLLSQMRSYGEDISNQRVVQKLLISLPRSYDSIASVIKNTKDLDFVDVQDVVAILKGYEQRIDRHNEIHNEKAFVSLNIAPKQNKYNGNQGSNHRIIGSQNGRKGIINLQIKLEKLQVPLKELRIFVYTVINCILVNVGSRISLGATIVISWDILQKIDVERRRKLTNM
ncbi:uncharacterized protein [Pyrus communis]|uniref:uncharacterized protein n=1 Tax=Pyrus communis TaxID=23211 RepID=UPI0035BED894